MRVHILNVVSILQTVADTVCKVQVSSASLVGLVQLRFFFAVQKKKKKQKNVNLNSFVFLKSE